MKKVCHLSTVHWRYDTRIFSKELCSLVEEYNTLFLVADAMPEENQNGVVIRSVVDAPPKNRLQRMLKTTKIMYKVALQEKADIYHFHDVELLPVGLKLKRHGKIVIYDAHESTRENILDRDYLPKPLLHLVANAVSWYEKRVAHCMDAVITVTPVLQKRFEGYGCNVALVCNYPRLEDYDLNHNLVRKNLAVYAGVRASRSRGLCEMVQASQLSGIPLIIPGRIDAAFKEELIALDQKHLVSFVGVISPQKVRAYLQEALIGLVTEHHVGYANVAYCVKMFEYMAAGNVVISADVPLWQEIVDSSHCGICVDPCNVEAIAEAEIYYMQHPKEALEAGKNGQDAICRIYNWETQAQILLSLYCRLLSR